MSEYIWMKTGLQNESVKVHLTLTDSNTFISWSNFKSGFETTVSLKSRQILAAHVEENNQECVHVHYVKVIVINKDRVQVKRDVVKFTGPSKDCSLLAEHIQRLLQTHESHRPKRLLVFINPGCGGAGNTKSYYSMVQPLLHLCGIRDEVVVTTHTYHPVEFLAEYDLDSIDAVVSMGGDGSLGIVARGLLSKTMSDAGVTLQHDDDRLLKPRVPLTTICGGSGNGMACSLHSSYDIEACTLSVILGQKVPYDVMTVHHDNKWIASCMLITSIGAFNNAMRVVEGLRWLLRKARYIFMFPLLWWNWEPHNVQIEYLPAISDATQPENSESTDVSDLDVQDGPKPGWKTLSLDVNIVQLTPWQQRSFFNYVGIEKYHKPDLSRDKMALSFVRACPFWFMFKYVKSTNEVKNKIFKMLAVKECRIKGSKRWNADFIGDVIACDGEYIPLEAGPDYSIKLHTDRLDLLVIDDVLVTEARLYADV